MSAHDSLPFAAILRRFRLSACLSQDELAEKSGLSTRAISDLERGLRLTPRLETVRMLADALDLDDSQRQDLIQAAQTKVITQERAGVSLPTALTSFVGREVEIDQLLAMVNNPEIRLVTLTGPGGVGKTRLAMRVGAELIASGQEGVTFLSLAGILEPAQFAPAIGQAFQLIDSTETDLPERLKLALSGQPRVLILDNLEHLVDATSVLAALLRSISNLKIVATSRVLLRISGEHDFPVVPMTLPEPTQAAESLAELPVVRLFLERSNLDRDEVTDDQLMVIASICRRLDGLPLAVELAASKTQLFSLEELHFRLEKRLPLLTGGPRDAPSRLQTMRAAIGWSYDHLDEPAQAVFRYLCVFSSGFTLESAQAVAGSMLDDLHGHVPGDASSEPPDHLIDHLATLHEHSLIHRMPGSEGRNRFSMLETIKEFGLDALAAHDEIGLCKDRHAAWFARRVDTERDGTWDSAHRNERQTDPAEVDNLRAALAWSLEQHEIVRAVRLAEELSAYWWQNGLYSEGRLAFANIHANAHALDHAALAAVIDWELDLIWAQGDHPAFSALATDALRRARELGLEADIARNLYRLGVTATQTDPAAAPSFLEEALTLTRNLNRAPEEVWCLLGLARASLNSEHVGRAKALHADAQALLAGIDPDAREWLALTLLQAQAQLAMLEGAFDDARSMLEEALQVARESENRFFESYTLFLITHLALKRDHLTIAAATACETFRLALLIGNRHRESQTLDQLASIANAVSQYRSGAIFLGAADAIRNELHLHDASDIYKVRAPARAALTQAAGQDAFDEWWSLGQTMTLFELMEEAKRVAEVALESGAGESALTSREREVLVLLAEGHTNKVIAERLFVSTRTVDTHVTSIFAKLGVTNRADAVAAARDRGELPVSLIGVE